MSLVGLLVALALVAAACGGDDDDTSSGAVADSADADSAPTELVFAAVPAEQTERLEDSFGTQIKILEDELNVTIEFFQAADYAGVIEAMIAGRVDIAQFGPFSYVIAHTNGADIQPIAAMTDSPEITSPGYQSYGITQGDNDDVTEIADFAGRRTCFVDPGSTSGYLYPSAGLLDVGIDPETGVEGTFAGGHDASGIAVANGDCEVGFAFDEMVTDRLIRNGDINEGDLKVVWESPVIPSSPIAMQNSLPDGMKEQLKTIYADKMNQDWALANGYCETAEECFFSDEDNWGYLVVENDFYDGVRQVCELTHAEACQG
jgi:phosphonate transport system substrate-binding protein